MEECELVSPKGGNAKPQFDSKHPSVRAKEWIDGKRAAGQLVILDLGCGDKKVLGAFGIDAIRLQGVDLVHNLEITPYPLPDNCADVIYLNHVLEHFTDPLPIMEEVWRLARPKGTVKIRTPHYSGIYAWKDPTHRRAFTSQSFYYFGENNYSYYTTARFHVAVVRLKYYMEGEEKYLPKLHRFWGRAVQWLLDHHPTFSERFFSYWVGGIDELQVTLEAIKPEVEALTSSEEPK